MSVRLTRMFGLAILLVGCLALPPQSGARPASPGQAGNDLDEFMAQVLARRDDNWRKLQQYVLDERERAEFTGPGGFRLFGLDREYTWYIRDGIFVRSPVKFDGVTLTEADRRKAEDDWIASERSRDKGKGAPDAATVGAPASGDSGVDAILRATREPQFVSAAYFLRFKFEPGHYGFVGPETYDGRQVLRIEYYPTALYSENENTKDDEGGGKDTKEEGKTKETKDTKDTKSTKAAKENGTKEDVDDRINRQMNKVALVTLWVEPSDHQIVQYRLDNAPLAFLPARSLVRINAFGATMRMGQPFPGIWLPEGIDAKATFTLANGTYDAHYSVAYQNYREAAVQVKIR
jgi:hypothetical protein